MSINRQYHTWIRRIRELRPRQRITQVRNFAWLLVGIHHSRSVTLSKVPGEAKLLSTVRRLGRLLCNPAIRVRDWYEPIPREAGEAFASAWLAAQFRHLGEIRLVVESFPRFSGESSPRTIGGGTARTTVCPLGYRGYQKERVGG